jgi:murein DD-endopeptidase MepM/ murein hydrolase activator NlpD
MKNPLLLLAFIAMAAVSFSFTTPPARRASSKKVYTRKTPVRTLSRSLIFPVAGNRSVIRDKWGASRAGGIRRHKGIDIHARKGTPVVALCDGIIVERDHTPIGGKTLWLKSGNQAWSAYYAHLDKQLVREGQRVRKGQVIGTVGNTGNARTTPSHLHFGVKRGNSWVNPLPYVKDSPKVAVKSAPRKKATYTKKKTASRRTRR